MGAVGQLRKQTAQRKHNLKLDYVENIIIREKLKSRVISSKRESVSIGVEESTSQLSCCKGKKHQAEVCCRKSPRNSLKHENWSSLPYTTKVGTKIHDSFEP